MFDQAGAGAGTAKMMSAPPALQPFVEHFWTQRKFACSAGERWRLPPDANPYLILTVSDSTSDRPRVVCRLVGPASGLFDIPVDGRAFTCGVRLRPGVLPLLVRLPASEIANGSLRVEEVFGARGRRLLEQHEEPAAWDRAPQRMAEFLRRELADHESFQALPARRVSSVRELAEAAGWSARRLQYRVTEQIGVSPKRWLRIERLHRAIAASLTGGRSWSEIAAHCGFADQPHMVREFVDLLGECPTTWRKRGPFVPSEEVFAPDGKHPLMPAAT